MPTIINPYGKGGGLGASLGESLSGLGEAFFGPKASTAAYTREKFREQQRQNLGVEDLATLLTNPNADPGAMAAAAARGGVAYNNLGGYNLFGVAGRNPNPRDPRVLQAQTQAQVPFAQTATGDAAHLANTRTIAQMQADKQAATQSAIADRTLVPVLGADGKLTYSRSVDAPGQAAPVTYDQGRGGLLVSNWANLGGLSTPQQTVLGADMKPKPQIYYFENPQGEVIPGGITHDGGRTDINGKPIVARPGETIGIRDPANPTPVLGSAGPHIKDLRDSRTATQTATTMIDNIVTDLRKPGAGAALGPVGMIGQVANNMRAQMDAISGAAREVGYGPQAELFTKGAESLVANNPGLASLAQRTGVDRAVLVSQISQLGYAIARANNQGGTLGVRDVSDAMESIGANIHDPVAFSQVLENLKGRLNQQQNIRERVMSGVVGPQTRAAAGLPNPNAAPAPVATPAPPTPGATAAPDMYSRYGLTPPGGQ